MSNLSKFKSKVSADKKLQKRMNEASTIKDVVKIAKSVGCNVSEREVKDDMMAAISGGGGGGAAAASLVSGAVGAAGGMGVNVDNKVGDVDFSMFDFSKYDAQISQAISGNGSTANNVGNLSISRDKTTNK